jgi:hypothetical protein
MQESTAIRAPLNKADRPSVDLGALKKNGQPKGVSRGD